jgi:DNA-binding SARP family transcriptional activator
MVGEVAMLTLRLLGRPGIERDGVPVRPPRGRKAWALLAYLLLAERPPARVHLAQLLFGEADDPLGALRWSLAELRRALGVTLTGDPVLLGRDGLRTDVERVTGADPDGLLDVDGELLEGVHLDANPEFESWLVVQRHHFAAILESGVRHAAVGLLAAGRGAEAIAYAARAVAGNPLDEGNHELLVRSLAMAGDHEAARRQVAVCEDLFRRELGVTPSAALRDALSAQPDSAMVPPVSGRGAALSQLEAGRAAILAGAADAGIQCLRRAVAEADRHGDDALRARCLAALGGALVHAVRGRDEEGAVVLREALSTATAAGDRATAVSAHRELGYIDVQAGRRTTAETWLRQATNLAETDEELAAVLGVRGMNASDAGDYRAAFVHFGESVERARRCGDERQAAFSLSLIGRAHLLRGEPSQASVAVAESLDLVQRQRWLAFLPWPQALSGEIDLGTGATDRAAEAFERAWTLANQVGDPCWQSLSARGLGLLFAGRGEHGAASDWLGEATARAQRTPDRYVWMLAHALDAAATHAVARHDDGRADALVTALAALAARGQMRELVVRAHLHRHRMGDPTALSAARMLAADIDNPALADVLRGP